MKQGICIALHGGDHKTGATMLAQCIAEQLAEQLSQESAMLVTLHGRRGGEYTAFSGQSVEGMRSYLEQQLLNTQELLRDCRVQERLYNMRGIFHPEQQRRYHPKLSQYLICQLRKEVSFIVADSGSEVDNGLAIGALQEADLRCLVLTQQETVLSQWECCRGIYQRLGQQFDLLIINRYLPEAVYTKEYLAERLEVSPDRILLVSDSPYGLRADGEKKSLLQYKDERFRQGICEICSRIAERVGINYPEEKRWKRWRGFI